MHQKRAKRHLAKLSEQVARIFLTCLLDNVLRAVWAVLSERHLAGLQPRGTEICGSALPLAGGSY